MRNILPVLACAAILTASFIATTQAISYIDIASLPVPHVGNSHLKNGDVIPANRSGVTYQLTDNIGGTCSSNQWANALTNEGVPTCTQPAFSSLSGTIARSQFGSSTNGQLFIGNSASSVFSLSTLTAGTGINIVNGNGSITITATGTGAPGGANTDIQFNNSGAFNGDGGLTYNGGLVTVGTGTPNGAGFVNASGFEVNGMASGAVNQLFYQTNTQLPNWREGLENVMAGIGDASLLCIGDSTTSGFYSVPSSTNIKQLSFCGQLTFALNAAGIPAESENFIGDGGPTTASMTQYDPRISLGSGWSQTTTDTTATVGGRWLIASSMTSNLAFTPNTPVNACDIYYPQVTSAGVMTYNIDGGSNTNINENINGTLQKLTVTISGALKKHTINFNYGSGGVVFFGGVDCYNNSVKQIHVLNAGWPGSKTSQWNNTTATYSPNSAGAVAAFAPNLVLLDLGINDWNNGISTTTFSTNYNALVANWQNSGSTDVMLVTPIPSNPAFASISNATQLTYVAKMYAAAATYSAPIIDMFNTFVSYAVSNPKGKYASDGVHGTGQAYADFARSLFQVLVPSNGVIAIQSKTPSGTGIGLGTATPINMLDVSGAISVGTQYAGISSAPTDGLIIKGNVGIGTNAPLTKLTINGNLTYLGTPPTLTCGSSPSVDANATKMSGTVTAGGGTLTSCAVTHATPFSVYAHCHVTSQTAGIVNLGYSYTLAAITITGTSLTGDVFDYQCDGQ